MTIAWQFADTGREYALSLANGELRHRTGAAQGASDAAVRISRTGLDRLIAGAAQPQELTASGELVIDGDAACSRSCWGCSTRRTRSSRS
jgi:alkyl sulfatase BDS1-like metallo-beta-lactamase superfamily hydrolase